MPKLLEWTPGKHLSVGTWKNGNGCNSFGILPWWNKNRFALDAHFGPWQLTIMWERY